MATIELEFQGERVAFCDPCWKKKTMSLNKMSDKDWIRMLHKGKMVP
jgi:hypothetical protein